MPDWSVPQLSVDDDGNISVDVNVNDASVDMSDVSAPEDVEVIQDVVSDGVQLDVSGNDVVRVSMSVEDFKSFVGVPEASLSENDPASEDLQVSDEDILPLAVDGNDISSSSFSPQAWQLNMAQNRPVGWHYVMTRTGLNYNSYVLVLGRDITYVDGLYTYTDCDYYSVYNTGSSGSTRYVYDVNDSVTGTISSTSYVVYSDLFFDYVGSRSVSYSWLILAFLVIGMLFLIFFRGRRQ